MEQALHCAHERIAGGVWICLISVRGGRGRLLRGVARCQEGGDGTNLDVCCVRRFASRHLYSDAGCRGGSLACMLEPPQNFTGIGHLTCACRCNEQEPELVGSARRWRPLFARSCCSP